MAWQGLPTATTVSVYSTGYGVGPNLGLNREDLLDVITNVDPWDNIVFAMLPKRRARSTTHEWPVDVLPVVPRTGVPDGADFDVLGLNISVPLRFKNYTQIFRWDVRTTGTEEAVDTAGMGEKLAYQILNATHAIAKAVEQRILDIGSNITGLSPLDLGANFTSSAGLGTTGVPGFGGAASVASSSAGRLMAPLFQLIPAAMISAYPWTSPVVDIAGSTLTATKVDDACQILFNNGLSPETLVIAPSHKRQLANDIYTQTGATAINTRFLQAEARKYVRGIDVYEGELCTLSVIPNRSIATTSTANAGYGTAWVLQKDKLGIAFLRPIKAIPIAKVGDNERKMLIGEMTLELLHPVAAAPLTRILG